MTQIIGITSSHLNDELDYELKKAYVDAVLKTGGTPLIIPITTEEKIIDKYINLIDGIENSWLYTKLINKNKRAQIIAKELNKPYIATADLHSLRYMDKDYTVINSPKLETEEIFKSLRNFKYKNVSKPKTLISLIKALFLTYF